MERMAVFYDDAAHARRLLEPLLARGNEPSLWVMVACAPRMTHRIGKWLSHSAREHWRTQWADQQRQALEPALLAQCGNVRFDWMLAKGPLPPLTQRLRQRHGVALRVLDARRPKLAELSQPLQVQPGDAAASARAGRLAAPLAVSSSLALVLTLAD
ncbi:hypothetical protein BurJ1DRAFT_4946 [Burkholderiales bacterium JOSHI_001]|nr:hypothetical protein BurJ1DRAFT_4946 [Burkholderiales bacterium JOSHI_001]